MRRQSRRLGRLQNVEFESDPPLINTKEPPPPPPRKVKKLFSFETTEELKSTADNIVLLKQVFESSMLVQTRKCAFLTIVKNCTGVLQCNNKHDKQEFINSLINSGETFYINYN